jgi:hypothetical protein
VFQYVQTTSDGAGRQSTRGSRQGGLCREYGRGLRVARVRRGTALGSSVHDLGDDGRVSDQSSSGAQRFSPCARSGRSAGAAANGRPRPRVLLGGRAHKAVPSWLALSQGNQFFWHGGGPGDGLRPNERRNLGRMHCRSILPCGLAPATSTTFSGSQRAVTYKDQRVALTGPTSSGRTCGPGVGRQWELEAAGRAGFRGVMGRLPGDGRRADRIRARLSQVSRDRGQSRNYAALGARNGRRRSGSRKRISNGEARGPWPGLPRGGLTAARWAGRRPK